MDEKLSKAIDHLASLFEYGALMASTDPAGFINFVAGEVIRLRASSVLSEDIASVNKRCKLLQEQGDMMKADLDLVRQYLAPFNAPNSVFFAKEWVETAMAEKEKLRTLAKAVRDYLNYLDLKEALATFNVNNTKSI